MSNFHGATSLIGGASGALDAIDGADLADLDGAVVITINKTYLMSLDVDNAGTESSPLIIAADANGGDKRWILTDLVCAGAEIIKDAANAALTISCYHDTEATTSLITLRKADGTLAVPALVDDNAVLGTIHFDGHDGSGWHTGAKIEARIQGTPSDGADIPTELTFWTTPEASATPVQRMTIDRNGVLGLAIEPITTWTTTWAVFQFGGNGCLAATKAQGDGGTYYSGQNMYFDGAWKYISNGEVSLYLQENGLHEFRIAPSGSANGALTWTVAMRILNNGKVGINDTNPGEMLDVDGNINMTGRLKIDDVEVVKEQQVHITDAPGDTAANNATTINQILAMLESHGLVASA